jgi:cytochrome P450
MHFDPNIWGDDARSFNPDRWLANGAKDLDKYVVTFSKGARACLGINLAYAEATLALAMLAERFTFTRDKTMTKADLSQRDNFTMAYVGSGLRVVVHEDTS